MRILILDLETRPNLAFCWALWDQNIGLSQIVETGAVISFAAKWHGERKVLFYSDFHDGHGVMVQAAWDLMDEADVIVHYNGKAFDIKWLHREFVLAGLAPPSPHKDVDLLTVARSRFKFTSNKLDHVAQQLGVGAKVKHSGFELWVKCLEGDAQAWALMKKYNVGDCVLTERVYDRLLPWIAGHPHHGLYSESGTDCCPNCGGTDLEKRGFSYTALGRYQQFRCRTCGGWSKSGKRLDGVGARGI